MTVAEAIVNPTASVVVLAQITAGLWARAWIIDGTLTTTYKVLTQFEDRNGLVQKHTITGLTVDGVAVTLRASAAAVNAAADGWYHDGQYLWAKPPAGTNIFTDVWVATCIFYLADKEKKGLNSLYWHPRLDSAPAISQRIEAVFGDVGQIGGGEMSLKNEDGFFSELDNLLWDAGTVTLLVGVDLPGGEMAWADYETLATWIVDSWRDDGARFQLRLVEPKARIKSQIPIDTFTREDYPSIDDGNVGRVIPIAYGANYGVAPIVINPGTKTFKVAGHEIKSFDGVRLKKTRVELITRTTDAASWLAYSGVVHRYYIADETVKTVTFKGTVLTENNDIDDVISTASTWGYVENYVYVHPPTSADWTSGVVGIESEISSPSLVTSNFVTRDIANGEFTLGEDWAPGTEVAVDFRGKVASGVYLENAIDIIEDLLTTAGETNLDAASFTAARAKLVIGLDENNDEVNVLRPSLYLTEPQDVIELVGAVCRLARCYTFSDATGQYSVGLFEPEVSEGLPSLDDMEHFQLEESFDVTGLLTKIISRYQNRPVDGFAQVQEEESEALQLAHDQPFPIVNEDQDLPTAFQTDAEYWAQAMLILLGRPLERHQIAAPWKYLTLEPGSQIVIDSDHADIAGVFEVLEKRIDLASKGVTMIVGNLRGFNDEPGFWVGDADVLPTRFSTLTGYGAGSLVWNSSWDDEIKAWARENVGYWTDANGFATTADAESFNTSVWV